MASESGHRPIQAVRGWRVLFRAGLCFALAQVIGGWGLDYLWPDVRFPQVGRVFAQMDALDAPPQIVFMGSSRFQGAISSGMFDVLLEQYTRHGARTFNAAVGAGDPIVAERILERMQREGRPPELIVVEISPEQLNRHSMLIGQQVIRQMTWSDMQEYCPEACFDTPIMPMISSRLMPLYVHRYQVRKQTIHRVVGASADADDSPPTFDYERHPPKLTELPPIPHLPVEAIEAKPVESPSELARIWLKDYQLSRTVTLALERMLRNCKTHGIKVLLVGAPTMSGHREQYTPAIERTYDDYVTSLIDKYGCRFVDGRAYIPDAGFGDPLHPHGYGGAVFSYTLARTAIIPWWRELHP